MSPRARTPSPSAAPPRTVSREELETRERQLREAQALAKIGSWEHDIASRAVSWSDELYRIHGLDPATFHPDYANTIALVHPDDRPAIEAAVARALADPSPFELDFRTVQPDGTVRVFHSRGRVVCDDAGRPARLIGTNQDVTEQRELMHRLAESEARLRLVGQATNDWVWDWDIVSGVIWWSDSFARLFGYAPHDLRPSIDDWLRCLHPDDRESVARSFREAIDGTGTTWSREYRFQRADGSYATVLDRAHITRDASGRATRAVGSTMDITERARSELVLGGTKRILEMLTADADLVAVLDALCHMIEEAAEGVSASLLLLDPGGVRLRHAAAPSLPEAYRRAIDGTAIGPGVGSCGTAAYRREPVIVTDIAHDPLWDAFRDLALPHGLRACWSTPVFDSEGDVLGTFALYAREPRAPTPDESRLIARAGHLAGLAIERQRAGEALRDSEERYRSLYEDSPLIYFTVDATGLVRSANKTAAQQLGYALPDLVGHSILQVFHPEDRPAVQEQLAAWVRGRGGPTSWEFRQVRRDGRELWARQFARPVTGNKGEPLLFIVCEDITQRRRAQEAVLRSRGQLRDLAARLQAIREEERTRIAREIHDDIGQALTALKIDLAYVEKRLPAGTQPLVKKVQEMAGLVDATVGTMHRIATELRPGVLDDLGLTAAVEWLGRDFARRTGLRVHVSVPPEDVTVGAAQATAVFRILQESLTNVARHARATEVDVIFRVAARALELIVRDNGIGITEQQITNPTSLGLLGMSERAQACGGIVSIVGLPAAGTTLTLFMSVA